MEVTLPLDATLAEGSPGLKVSVILVSYNQALALRRAVAALEKSEKREQMEILVIDCGSQDGSQQIDHEYPGVTVLRLPHHLGAARAMNIGVRTSKADLLFLLSPNVEVAPDGVAKLTARLEEDPDATAACPLLIDPSGRPVSRLMKLPNRKTLAAACGGGALPGTTLDLSQERIDVEYPCSEAILVRKQFVKGMNSFDERFGHFWADADLAAQIRRAQRKIRLYPAIHVVIHPAANATEDEAAFKADCILGAAAFIGKYEGFSAGLQFRIAAILKALAGFRIGEVMALIGGQKIDGSQAG